MESRLYSRRYYFNNGGSVEGQEWGAEHCARSSINATGTIRFFRLEPYSTVGGRMELWSLPRLAKYCKDSLREKLYELASMVVVGLLSTKYESSKRMVGTWKDFKAALVIESTQLRVEQYGLWVSFLQSIGLNRI